MEKILKLFVKKQQPVHITAVGHIDAKKAVYNITVEEAHLYYANGVLVGNSKQEDHEYDCTKVAFMSRPISPIHSKPEDTRIEKLIKSVLSPTAQKDVLDEIYTEDYS